MSISTVVRSHNVKEIREYFNSLPSELDNRPVLFNDENGDYAYLKCWIDPNNPNGELTFEIDKYLTPEDYITRRGCDVLNG